MSKIRINELARELEVKPNRILELLPEFGVEEKKTHSSSIDEDVAVAIKKKLGIAFDSDSALRAERDNYRAVAVEDPPDESMDEVPSEPEPEPREASPLRVDAPKIAAEEPASALSADAAAKLAPPASRPSPLRPPL